MQVLQESSVAVTRSFATPLPCPVPREVVALNDQWPVIQIDLALMLEASRLEERQIENPFT